MTPVVESSGVDNYDIATIIIYFCLVLATGFYAMFKTNRGTVNGYFLAGRFMTWLPVGASLFASNIGSEHFIGLAGSGAASGIGVGAFELNALIIIQLLGWVFLPVYIASGVSTLPEYMHKRFGGHRIRVYLAVLSLILYIFTKVSVNMYSGALFVREALGWDIYAAVFLVLAMTALCTITGGLAAVIYTDTIQAALMIVGASGLSIFAFTQVGGYTGLMAKYPHAYQRTNISSNHSQYSHSHYVDNHTCGLPNPDAFRMLRRHDDDEYPWIGFLLGQSPASVWYWAADQMMVQRTLSAKSLSHAQGATIFAGYLKILPLFIMVMPGMISRVLYPDLVGCVDDCEARCGNPVSCSNLAYPSLVMRLLPSGLKGAMLAVMLAALVSDLTSIFNSASTLFTIDIWARIRPTAPTREKLLVGRLWVVVMVVVSIVWVPIVQLQQGGQLYIYIQTVAADLSPPIAAVFLLAILWKRTNEQGAFWGLMVGFAAGLVRMLLEFLYAAPACGHPDLRPSILASLHYMYFATFLFWLTLTVVVIASLATPPVKAFRLIRATYWTRFDATPRPDEEGLGWEAEELRDLRPPPGDVKPHSDQPPPQLLLPSSRKTQGRSVAVAAARFARSFCGEDGDNARDKALEEERLRKLTTLHQTTNEKLILNINLAIIMSVSLQFFATPCQTQKGFQDGGSVSVHLLLRLHAQNSRPLRQIAS